MYRDFSKIESFSGLLKLRENKHYSFVNAVNQEIISRVILERTSFDREKVRVKVLKNRRKIWKI